MNLIITNSCNRQCPYCFAKSNDKSDGKESSEKNKYISLENVKRFLSFLKQSNVKRCKILGGEPTLHPELPEIINLALDNELTLVIFTNGLWSDSVREYFENLKSDNIQFLFNVNEPSKQMPWENARQLESLTITGSKAVLGFNIYQDEFDLLFTIDLINALSLKREVRLGLASPIAMGENAYIESSALKRAGKRLAKQLRELEKNDILGAMDCGFPLCMFDEDDLGSLALTVNTGFKSICSLVLDVDHDLNVWPCYPLRNIMNVSLNDFINKDELVKYYSSKMASLRSIGSMEECVMCKFLRRNQCSGGCFSRIIKSCEESGDFRLTDKLGLVN